MKTTGCYYMILSVYVSLWSCQMITCHLTHSLIVLTDSYINLYKILDISLGILHLHTQRKVRNRLNSKQTDTDKGELSSSSSTVTLFDSVCTYNFKRLPVLGSFVNGLFLGALLLSAAIEGIQTCFHANHSGGEDDQVSILLEHPVTYPGILIGFAVVGAMMQWCSLRAHEMREEELGSESLLDLRSDIVSSSNSSRQSISELDVKQLSNNNLKPKEIFLAPPEEVADQLKKSTKEGGSCLSLCMNSKSDNNKFVLNKPSNRPKSFESVPLDDDTNSNNDDQFTKISLKSLKLVSSDALFENNIQVSSISKDLESEGLKDQSVNSKKVSVKEQWWTLVRYCIAPTALITCALIIYFIHEEMVTEITDAFCAILVVILLFTASYPPMKKAGKVLLQTAPDEVDLDRLKRSIKSVSPLIKDISQLHVWSLTARSNRIATCHIYLNKDKIESDEQVSGLLRQVKFKFLSQNIKCSTIQPIFDDPAKQDNQEEKHDCSNDHNHHHHH